MASPSNRFSRSTRASMFVVCILIGAAFVPSLFTDSPESPIASEPMALGSRQVTYTISNIGESYVKDSSLSSMGRHGSTPGLNEWWTVRDMYYTDTICHNSYPYSILWNPNSVYNTYPSVTHMGFGQYGFYTFSMDAYSLTNFATGPGKDPLILPILGTPSGIDMDGGTVNFDWYITYLTSSDISSITSGTHYANSYYGVSASAVYFAGAYMNDGWFLEHQGHMDFDRYASKKFLGLPGIGDLRTEFNLANINGAINGSWAYHYDSEGNAGAIYDTFACYDYSTDPVKYFLSVDPESTYDQLKLRIWGYSWGVEYLFTRYMDVLGLMRHHQTSMEDWSLSGTVTSEGGSLHSSMTSVYNMLSWTDLDAWSPAWVIEASHLDRTWSDLGWISRYNPYDAYSLYYKPVKREYVPGTTTFGQDVAFWNTPMNWDLAAGETLVVELPYGPYLGYEPFKGIVPDSLKIYGAQKVAELSGHQIWGELVLGNGFPAALRNSSMYDDWTKTLTIVGPYDFPRNPDSMFPFLNETGSPSIMLSVSKVSEYNMSLVEPGPYLPGQDYTISVRAMNVTGDLVPDWNGTVDLAATVNVILSENSHTFASDDHGIWNTTVHIMEGGGFTLWATDTWFPLDVTGIYCAGIFNNPPEAVLTVEPSSGDPQTVFLFDASASHDVEDPIEDLYVRWDFDSDGVFDTFWTKDWEVFRTFASAGTHTVTVEVMDTIGGQDTASASVEVSWLLPPPVTVAKVKKLPSDPVSWTYTPTAYGTWTFVVENSGFRSMVLEIYDVTNGSSAKVFEQALRLDKLGVYPTGTVTSDPFLMIGGHTYQMVVRDYSGPMGASAVIYSAFV